MILIKITEQLDGQAHIGCEVVLSNNRKVRKFGNSDNFKGETIYLISSRAMSTSSSVLLANWSAREI